MNIHSSLHFSIFNSLIFTISNTTKISTHSISFHSSPMAYISTLVNLPISPPSTFFKTPTEHLPNSLSSKTKNGVILSPSFVAKNELIAVDNRIDEMETMLYSVNPLPLMLLGALPGAGAVRSVFEPFVELIKTLNLPGWLVHWGHPANMAVVLFAMGGYGTYLGFRIRFSDDVEEKAKARDLHPKLLGGMFFFFALGATGGVTALLTSDKPIFESPHAVTGLIGLSLLTIQTILPFLFEGKPELRNVHGILGSGIMTLFLVHAALGLQFGLTF